MVKYKNNGPQYDLILGTVSMKEFGVILNFWDKMITIDEMILPMRKGSTKRTLCGNVLFKLNTFLVMFLHVPSFDSTCFLRM